MINSELALRFVNADRLGQEVRLPGSKCSIGAGENCTLRLAGHGLRPVHCFIVRGPGGTVVRRWSADTRLNGRPFRDAILSAGDRLSLGNVELEVIDGVPPSPSIDALSISNEELAAKQQELAALREQLRASREQLTEQAAAQMAQGEAWNNERHEWDVRLLEADERARRESDRFTQQLAAFAQVQTEWHVERDDLLARCARLQGDMDAADKLMQEASVQKRCVTEAWSAEQAAALQVQREAQDERDAAQRELESTQRELAAKAAEHLQAHQAWEQEVQHWRLTANEREAQLDRREAELAARASELSREADKLQHARENLESERIALQDGHRTAHDRITERMAALEAHEAELSARVLEVEDLQSDVASRKDALAAERAALEAELAAARDERDAQRAYAERLAADLVAQRSDFEAEQFQWQDERRSAAALLDEQQDHVAALQQELAELRSALDTRLPEEPRASVQEESDDQRDEVLVEVNEPSSNGNSEAMLALERQREAALQEDDEIEAEPFAEAEVDELPAAVAEHGAAVEESDVSIEDYMEQLMQRVRGKSDDEAPSPKRKTVTVAQQKSPPVVATPVNVPAAVKPSVATDDRVKTEIPCKPLEALRTLPARAAAPEQPRSLQAMRELANQSARSAIDTSSQNRWRRNVRGKFAVSIASAVCGGALFTFGDSILSWTSAAAVGSLAAAVVFGTLGYKMQRHGIPTNVAETSNPPRET